MTVQNESFVKKIFGKKEKKKSPSELLRDRHRAMSDSELKSHAAELKSKIPHAKSQGSLVGGAVRDAWQSAQNEIDRRARVKIIGEAKKSQWQHPDVDFKKEKVEDGEPQRWKVLHKGTHVGYMTGGTSSTNVMSGALRVGRQEHKRFDYHHGTEVPRQFKKPDRSFNNKDDLSRHVGKMLSEEAPTNSVGSGAIKGTGGPGGEPGVQPKWMKKHREENARNAPSPIMSPMQKRKTFTQFIQGK